MSSYQAERERLQASIHRDRRELEVALSDLKSELRSTAEQKLDPRERIARHPYHWLGLAFLVGLWLGRPRQS